MNLPIQVSFDSLLVSHPEEQAPHSKLPAVLLHVRDMWQVWVPSVHSSTSAKDE